MIKGTIMAGLEIDGPDQSISNVEHHIWQCNLNESNLRIKKLNLVLVKKALINAYDNIK